MKKIVTMTVLFCTIFSTTAFAASKSGTFNFLKHQAKGYLNTHKFYNAEASTVRTGGKADKNMHVALYATSKKGARLYTATNRSNPNNVYVSGYAMGSEKEPLKNGQSQHSIAGTEDPYYYLTLSY